MVLLSVCDRVATRGDEAGPSIERHLALAAELIGPALAWSQDRALPPVIRGDALADALGIAPGPELGDLLAELDAARYSGEVTTPDEAIAYAEARLASRRTTASHSETASPTDP